MQYILNAHLFQKSEIDIMLHYVDILLELTCAPPAVNLNACTVSPIKFNMFAHYHTYYCPRMSLKGMSYYPRSTPCLLSSCPRLVAGCCRWLAWESRSRHWTTPWCRCTCWRIREWMICFVNFWAFWWLGFEFWCRSKISSLDYLRLANLKSDYSTLGN